MVNGGWLLIIGRFLQSPGSSRNPRHRQSLRENRAAKRCADTCHSYLPANYLPANYLPANYLPANNRSQAAVEQKKGTNDRKIDNRKISNLLAE